MTSSSTTPLLVNEDSDGYDSATGDSKYGSDDDTPADPNKYSLKDNSSKFVYFLAFLSCIGGFLFGYDTGVVSGAMLLIRDKFSLNSFWQELVVSATIGAAAVFAGVGGFVNDLLGRKPTILTASAVFTIGAVVLGSATSTEMLLAGRIIVGIGIGFASTTVPMYIAESSPANMRGRLVTMNNLFITGGQFVASLVDGAFSYDKENGWRYMLGLAGVPSLIQFIGFIFMPESPRYLVKKGKYEKAKKILQSIRNSTDVQEELQQIKDSCNEAEKAKADVGKTPLFIQMLTTSHVRKALIVGCGLLLFQQISGINTVMYYSATIIKMSGVRSASAAIWLAALVASVNFLFTFVGLYLVEKIGRRSLTIGSLIGTTISLGVLALSFQLSAFNSPPVANITASQLSNSSCAYSTVYPVLGSCLIASEDHSRSISGLCNATSNSEEIIWAYEYCPTAYSWMALFGLVLYLACFAPGMGPMPWTINSEIYPLWARSAGTAAATSVNWIFNLFISLTFLTFTQMLTRYGAFWMYTGFAFVGVIFLAALLPETKGKSLEEVEILFRKPWC